MKSTKLVYSANSKSRMAVTCVTAPHYLHEDFAAYSCAATFVAVPCLLQSTRSSYQLHSTEVYR